MPTKHFDDNLHLNNIIPAGYIHVLLTELKMCILYSVILVPDPLFDSTTKLTIDVNNNSIVSLVCWTKLFWIDVLLYKNKISQGTFKIFLSFKLY